MSRQSRPGVDPVLAPRLGVSRDGQPVSYNRLPAPDLAPWVGWLYATSVAMPEDYQLQCSLFSDNALVRIQLSGDWTAQTRDGTLNHQRAAMYCGPQSRAMPISVRGSFTSVGFALMPGAGYTVTGQPASDFLDRMVRLDDINLPGSTTLDLLEPELDPEAWLQALEQVIRAVVAGRPKPDPITRRFEMLALTDPNESVADFAAQCGISQRQLERICRRDFGLPPKQVLRRARAIDMASHLRGVADSEEAASLELRYYDQSHMIREFTQLFGMSPRQFVASPQPLMTLALESRQSRRLSLLDRLEPGQEKPWMETVPG